jgi:hypothetical protein
MLGVPIESIHLDDLVEIDSRLIAYIKGLDGDHQSAVQYVCNKNKLLDLAHELGGWASRAYMLRKSWLPIRLVLKGKARGCIGIIEYAIAHGRMPGNLTVEFMEDWKRAMLGRGRSLLTVSVEESHFRTTLREGLQHLFPAFILAIKRPPKLLMRLEELPESLRDEILEVVHWKTVDEDLDDRDADLMIRPVTGENLLKYLLQLCGYAIRELELRGILHLRQLITEEIVCGFVDLLLKDGRCRARSIISKLSTIHFLTLTYPKLKGKDQSWFRAKLDTLRKEKNGRVQARKLDGNPDYESVAAIASKLLALRQAPNELTEVELAWLTHDALVFLTTLANPHRSRNICKARIHFRKRLNIFESEISSELLSQIKLPAWAKEVRDKDPRATFVVYHAVEMETKAGQEIWECFPQEALSLYKEYVQHYRPVLLRGYDPNSTSLFFARNRKQLTQKSLLNLVSRLSIRYTGKRMTVKLFRDLVGANMLASGATVEEVAARLWQIDPNTTVRYYIGGYNSSDAVAALEDELAALAA